MGGNKHAENKRADSSVETELASLNTLRGDVKPGAPQPGATRALPAAEGRLLLGSSVHAHPGSARFPRGTALGKADPL